MHADKLRVPDYNFDKEETNDFIH